MNECLRVRLEFQKFLDPNLRNCLLSFRRNDIKDVRNLQILIQKRYNLEQKFILLIDGFVLDPPETIDVLRDNDLIVVEAKVNFSINKVKKEPKSEVLSTDDKKYSSYLSDKQKESKTKAKIKKQIQKEVKECELKKDKSKSFVSNAKSGEKFKSKPLGCAGHQLTPIKLEKSSSPQNTHSKPSKTVIESKTESVSQPKPEWTSLRDIPLRKAFQNANSSMKRPQPSIVKPQNDSTPTTSDTPKSKRRRQTKEAVEPVDRFSPIVILERQPIHIEDHFNDSKEKEINVLKVNNRKQSARKSFPNHSKDSNIKSDINSTNNTKIVSEKSIDFENCQSLTTIPNVGDIIAFKILTLSSDGNGYESSLFKIGSVLNVNKDTQMVDILLQDVIKRNNLKTMNKNDEQTLAIHSLKINWTTVLEPKLIQSQTQPEMTITID